MHSVISVCRVVYLLISWPERCIIRPQNIPTPLSGNNPVLDHMDHLHFGLLRLHVQYTNVDRLYHSMAHPVQHVSMYSLIDVSMVTDNGNGVNSIVIRLDGVVTVIVYRYRMDLDRCGSVYDLYDCVH